MTPNRALFAFYLSHAACYLLIAASLQLLHRSYGRAYLRHWAWSWWALCCHRALGALAILPLWGRPPGEPLSLLVTWLWLTTSWWHAYWLVVGTLEVTRPGRTQATVRGMGALAGLGVVFTWGAAWIPGFGLTLRLAGGYLPTSIACLAAAALLLRAGSLARFGPALVSCGLVAFGAQRAVYLATGLRPRDDLVAYFQPVVWLALTDFPMLAVLGVGMIVWLLDEESALRRDGALMESQGIVVAGLAHEVRNPLFAMSASLDSFDATPQATELGAYTSHLRQQIRTLARQMDRLIEFGRPLEGRFTYGLAADVARSAVRELAPLAEAKGLRVDLAARGTTSLAMDPRRLAAALQMLIENAIDHTPSGGRVLVEVLETGDAIELRVADEGGGFSARAPESGAEPFFTEHANRAGLGLAIARRIVEAHGGSLALSNAADDGGRAVLRLPLQGRL